MQGNSSITKVLQGNGVKHLLVKYGWGCNLDIDSLWRDIAVETDGLVSFAHLSESQGIYRLGSSDLIIEDNYHSFRFLLCHESDIHLETHNESLIEAILYGWNLRGLGVLKSGPDGKWVPV
jgi:hypothetical protein